MANIGYARVSSGEQTTDLQLDALNREDCRRIFEETASGAQVDRPHSDAELLSLGQIEDALAKQFDEVMAVPLADLITDEAMQILRKMKPYENRIASIRAKTLAGLQVKVRIALWSYGDTIDVANEPTLERQMLWSVIEDIMGLIAEHRPGALI